MKSKLRNQYGMTLVETLIALLMTGIITAAMFRVYINQHQSWMIQDSVIEMQQSARASIDELTRQLRMTGYGLPNGMIGLFTYDENPDSLVIYYRVNDNCDAPLVVAMSNPTDVLDCTGNDVSCFLAMETAYIYDPYIESGEFFEISSVQTGASHIQHMSDPLSRAYPAGSEIMTIDRIKFFIDDSDTTHPNLMIQVGDNPPEVYGEDITDLQFTFMLKNGFVMDEVPEALTRDVRRIGIKIDARTQRKNEEFGDPYRYETYESTVSLRN